MLVSLEDYTRREVVLGAYGGQLASFEWVFSPRGADGLPVPMFDRTTGTVDSAVIAYWKEHYDVAEHLRHHWPELRRDLEENSSDGGHTTPSFSTARRTGWKRR
jgi:hypothetical protein